MAGPTEYQWVITSTNYDSDHKFPRWLRFDGVDDYLNLPYMGLYANGNASVVVARKGLIATVDDLFSESWSAGTNAYYRLLRYAGITTEDHRIRDDAVTAAITRQFTCNPLSVSVQSVIDSGSQLLSYQDNVQIDHFEYARSGILTLNKTTIGALVRTTVSDFAQMNLYGLIVTKSALTDAQRVRCERFLARKAGVML